LCALALITAATPAFADDIQIAADMYKEAETMKRDHQFDNARQLFESVRDMDEISSGTWGELAADELRYGLPLFEADHWMVKYARSSDKPERQDEYRQNAQNLYQLIIDQNGDKPERIVAIQQKLDQVAISSAYLNTARSYSLRSSLEPMRQELRQRFSMFGKWPDETWMRDALVNALTRTRLPKDKLVIDEYWVDKTRFRLYLMDHQTKSGFVMVGDENGITIDAK
jgi:hypothetical protein